ncbi:MAG: hypothetical protein GKR94_27530 [Gammaproteobacteria bacterium]|nr:hypothetical protein [Gammaproteobacteria bacterium]
MIDTPSIDTDWICRRYYGSVRDKLLAWLDRDASASAIHRLVDIAEQMDVFVLDAFGVFNVGDL